MQTEKTELDLIMNAIDMDQWKHSWHNDLDDVKDMHHIVNVINDKIAIRNEEIDVLMDGLKAAEDRVKFLQQFEDES